MYKRIEDGLNSIIKMTASKDKVDKFNLYLIISFLILLMIPMAVYNFQNIDPMQCYNYLYLLIIPMLYVFIYNIKNKYHKNSLDFILISIFMIIALISSVHAFNPWMAIFGYYSRKTGYLTYIIYYLIYVNSKNINDKSSLFKILDIMLTIGMMNAFFAFLQVYLPYNFINKLHHYMGYGLVGHPNFLGSLSTILLSLSFYISLFISDRKFYKYTSIVMFISLILASSTGPFLSFGLVAFVLFIYIIIKRRDLFKKIFMYALIFGAVFITIEVSSTHISKIYKPNVRVDNIGMDILSIFKIVNNEDVDVEKSLLIELEIEGENTKLINSINGVSSGRLYIYKSVVNYIGDGNYIWLGTGPDNMHIYAINYKNRHTGQIVMTEYDKAHNIYLNVIAETGIFSFICYVAWIVCYHIKAKKCKNELMYLLLFGLISYNIQGLFNIDVYMVMPYYLIVAGMLMGIGDKLETRKH